MMRWLLSLDCDARRWAGSINVSLGFGGLKKELTVVYKDIVEDRNQVWDKTLILEVVDEGDDVLSFDDSSSVFVCISTRVTTNA